MLSASCYIVADEMLGDLDIERKTQAEVLLHAYSRELDRQRLSAGAQGLFSSGNGWSRPSVLYLGVLNRQLFQATMNMRMTTLTRSLSTRAQRLRIRLERRRYVLPPLPTSVAEGLGGRQISHPIWHKLPTSVCLHTRPPERS